ncbi:MAG: NAD-binding protein [Anaerolineae bacterium]
MVAVAASHEIQALQGKRQAGGSAKPHNALRQALPALPRTVRAAKQTYSQVEASSRHRQDVRTFCDLWHGEVARNAVSNLDLERPFVIISDDNDYTNDLIERGSRVVHGNPTRESTLRKAGVKTARWLLWSPLKTKPTA